jgi:glycerol-3-phosphate dehydrogenase
VEAERAAEAMPDDDSAEAARLQAPEITPFASAS